MTLIAFTKPYSLDQVMVMEGPDDYEVIIQVQGAMCDFKPQGVNEHPHDKKEGNKRVTINAS